MQNKPNNVPALDFNLMNKNLEKEKRKAKENQMKKKKRAPNSNPGRRANSQDNYELIPNMLDNINHNKYAKKVEYKEDEDYKESEKDKIPQEYQYEEYNEGESSPCSCSY